MKNIFNSTNGINNNHMFKSHTIIGIVSKVCPGVSTCVR